MFTCTMQDFTVPDTFSCTMPSDEKQRDTDATVYFIVKYVM